ncbi:MAG: hydrogenase expression/formation protein HypE [Candidatus Omnitrophota bacterium]
MIKRRIMLAHGSGGRLMHGLIKELLLKKLNNPILAELSDSALIKYKDRIVFSTDSFVVTPLFFPGGDIGKLAVCGTANDLVMLGGLPEYLALSLIIEEGLDYRILEKIIESISREIKKTGISIVTGDIKVVEKGAADKIFINTSGIGRVKNGLRLSAKNIRSGDRVIITGKIGQHGLAVLAGRRDMNLGFNIKSDCAALADLLLPVLMKIKGIRFMRDPTRGGVATTLNEITESSGLGIVIEEKFIPVSGKVRAACELLGLDPLYLANEGRAIIIVAADSAKRVLSLLRAHPLGKDSGIIGSVVSDYPSQVVMNTVLGTQRIIEMLAAEALPRIC